MSFYEDRQQGLRRYILHALQNVTGQSEEATCDTADSSGTNSGALSVFSLVLTFASEHETWAKPGPSLVLRHLPASV